MQDGDNLASRRVLRASVDVRSGTCKISPSDFSPNQQDKMQGKGSLGTMVHIITTAYIYFTEKGLLFISGKRGHWAPGCPDYY